MVPNIYIFFKKKISLWVQSVTYLQMYVNIYLPSWYPVQMIYYLDNSRVYTDATGEQFGDTCQKQVGTWLFESDELICTRT